jgi:hypothetical protein
MGVASLRKSAVENVIDIAAPAEKSSTRSSGASSTKRKAADRLGQSAFDLFGSPICTVFLGDPVR